MSVQNSSFIGPLFKIKLAGALTPPFARRQTKKCVHLQRYLFATARVLKSLNAQSSQYNHYNNGAN